MTIIFANAKDVDCSIMPRMWKNWHDAKVIEITPDMSDWEEIVDDAIAAEDDFLFFIGHGTTHGLLFPDFRGEYIVHENNVHLIHAKKVYCSWCYASTFVLEHNIHNCVTSSMFISNLNEAYDNCIYSCESQEDLNQTNKRFDDEIVELIENNIPMKEWVSLLDAHTDSNDEIDVFNREGMIYNE